MRQGWRLAAVGAFLAGLFAILLLRMWFLQVGTIEDSLLVAESQQIQEFSIEAPRGDIFDRNGRELMAGTVATLQVVVNRKLVPEEREEGLVQSLSALLGLPASAIWEEFDAHASGSRFPIGGELGQSTGVFVLENIEDFPGVTIEPVPVRIYPLGATAAHLIGYIGSPGPEDLDRVDIDPQDSVGKFGLERSYDRLLRGTPGSITYRINARGEILGVVEEVPPRPGGSVVTTIDLDLQRFLETTLDSSIRLARQEGEDVIRAAGVVLDPTDGSVLAMASVPAFDPTLFADGEINDQEWQDLSEKAVLNNFAIQGLYPPGSSFKVVAYSLAQEEGIFPDPEEPEHEGRLDPNDPTDFFCDGQLLIEATPPLNDWRSDGHGVVNISESLHQSCNLYYWSIARKIWDGRGVDWEEDLLQQWARTLGFGSRTGIDLPFEQEGLVPDREWFQFHQQNKTQVVRAEGGWVGGDVMNIATGQGALTVTPIQMAVAYAALANGGTVWQPRVVGTVRNSENEVIFSNVPSATDKIDLEGTTTVRFLNDIRGVVSGPNGTARRAFEGFCDDDVPDSECAALQQVGGKTGTAEIRQAIEDDEIDIDTAWFVGVAPLDDPQFVVAIVVDQGGSGGKIAAPTARRVFQFLLGEKPDPITTGEDTER